MLGSHSGDAFRHMLLACSAWAVAAERVSVSSRGHQAGHAASSDEMFSQCNMKTLDAADLSGDDVVTQLVAENTEPILLRNAMAQWSSAGSLEAMVANHGDVPLTVVRGAELTNDVAARDNPSYRLSLADYSAGIGAGDVSPEEYVFSSVGNTSIASGLPDLSNLFANVSCGLDGDFCLVPQAARGTLHLAFGGDRTFNGLHRHGNALNALVAGEKHWVAARPSWRWRETDFDIRALDQFVRREAAAARSWSDVMWRCTQREGDLMWTPAGIDHGVLNRGERVVALVTQQMTVVRTLGDSGIVELSALHQVAIDGIADEARALLEAGVAIDAKGGKESYSALHFACMEGHAEVARVLLEHGADADATSRRGTTALHLASFRGHAEAARVLLERDARLHARDEAGNVALHRAAVAGRPEVARLLLERGATVDARNNVGATPLHLAASSSGEVGHGETVSVLLQHGAVVDATDTGAPHGHTGLHIAAYKGNAEVARALLEGGASMDAKDPQGATPLQIASSTHPKVAKLLRLHLSKRAAAARKAKQTAK